MATKVTQVHRGSTFLNTNNVLLNNYFKQLLEVRIKAGPHCFGISPHPPTKKKIKKKTTTTNKPEGMTDFLVKLLYFLT